MLYGIWLKAYSPFGGYVVCRTSEGLKPKIILLGLQVVRLIRHQYQSRKSQAFHDKVSMAEVLLFQIENQNSLYLSQQSELSDGF
jgi:hypothetical protein